MKHKRMFRAGSLLIVIVLLLAVGRTLYNRPLPAEAAQPHVTQANQTSKTSLPLPTYGAAAIGTTSDGLLAGHNMNQPIATASIAKIMTALAVLKQRPLALNQSGPVLTLDAQDVALYQAYVAKDGSVVPVSAGEQISQYQVLQAMLLPSANNLADTLANWAFGSAGNYSAYANQLAKSWGMTQSNFTGASGFDASTVSSAHDLFILGQHALQDPVVSQIASQRTAVLPVAGMVYNVNLLLGKYNIDGLKTGNNDQDRGAFLFSSSQTLPDGKPVRILGVVMGADSLIQAEAAAPPLITATLQNFTVHYAARKNQTFGSYTMPWNNQRADVVAAADSTYVAWNGTPAKTSVELDNLNGAHAAGTEVGTATVTSGKQTIKVPLVLKDRLSAPSAWWRLTHR